MNTKPPLTPDTLRLDDLLARVVDCGGCLVWQGWSQQGNHPQWRMGGRKKSKSMSVRRMLWELTRYRLGRHQQVGVGCGTPNCVHPDHLVARTQSVAMRGPKSPLHALHIAQGKRRGAKISQADVDMVRADGACMKVEALRLGMSLSHVRNIRAGRRWRELYSPFAGLGSRGK